MSSDVEARLLVVLDRFPALAIAVSGGVDSMTLASAAHRKARGRVAMIHAVSPAVPAAASERVRTRAAREGWDLIVTGAGEFEDERYRANPADRCYFCKTNLYARIRALTQDRIASGANIGDLGDYRPGLLAAAERDVVHPFIEAGIDKPEIRVLARRYGLDEVAELPAQPCLASRVETGIAINADDLAFVDRVETTLARLAPANATLRCRVTHKGIVVELGEDAAPSAPLLRDAARALCDAASRPFLGVQDYRKGAMFLRG